MKFGLLAISVLGCANALFAAQPSLAVFYSFDTAASPAILATMQSELARILAPSGVSATWLPSDARRVGESFPGLAVLHFRGECSFAGASDSGDIDASGKALAQTATIEGHVLPFATVNCDRVRDFIAPMLRSMPPDWKTQVLGRALARVSAHEIYHILAGVRTHDDRDGGIFQTGHSRQNLTSSVFSFAAPENDWLRGWLERQTPREQVAHASPRESASAFGYPVSAEPDSGAFAGR